MSKRTSTSSAQQSDAPPRRGFLVRFLAATIGAVAGLVPAAASLYTFFDPLRKKPDRKRTPDLVRIANLTEVPADGVPRRFEVITDQWNQWTFTPQQPVGAVFLVRRPGESKPTALHVTCPHAGCAIGLASDRTQFKCPCHNSAFKLDGTMIQPTPSPRDMDRLVCEVRGGEVWLKYQNFHTGKAQAIPKS
jgi:Rieske Fe-S protein